MIGDTVPATSGVKIWIFNRVPMTLNQMLGAHWTKKTKDKRSWDDWVLARAGRRRGRVDLGRVKLTIQVYRKVKQDPDNRTGSVKYLVDALNRAGWLVDDSDEWLDLEVKPELIDRKKPRTEVIWTPIKDMKP